MNSAEAEKIEEIYIREQIDWNSGAAIAAEVLIENGKRGLAFQQVNLGGETQLELLTAPEGRERLGFLLSHPFAETVIYLCDAASLENEAETVFKSSQDSTKEPSSLDRFVEVQRERLKEFAKAKLETAASILQVGDPDQKKPGENIINNLRTIAHDRNTLKIIMTNAFVHQETGSLDFLTNIYGPTKS